MKHSFNRTNYLSLLNDSNWKVELAKDGLDYLVLINSLEVLRTKEFILLKAFYLAALGRINFLV